MNVNDKVSMEYEAHAMVSEKQYHEILSQYLKSGYKVNHVINKNTYFDNDELYLTHHDTVLRKRQFNEKLEATVKRRVEKGNKEINVRLDDSLIDSVDPLLLFNDDIIIKVLNGKNVSVGELKVVGELTTDRYEFEINPNCLLVVDKNDYNHRIDYNVEVEASSKEEAKEIIKSILSNFGATYKKDYVSKSRRAILKK